MRNSPLDPKKIPDNISNKHMMRKFFYKGVSMNPTFRLGHMLYVRPDVQDVKPGDVVVYQKNSHFNVHRVLSVGKDGFLTRGDNNLITDTDLLAPTKIIGRVEFNEIQGEIGSVHGGRRGLWVAQIRWVVKLIERWFRNILGWIYHLLKASRLVERIWKLDILCIRLESKTGTFVKYIYRKKTVATWYVCLERFECRKPFDLVIPSPLGKKHLHNHANLD